MIRKYKKQMIVSSILILLPIVYGLLFWEQLPPSMITHWGADGQPDGFSSRSFAVFALPLILLAGHWFCMWFTMRDVQNQDQHPKAIQMVLWIMPCVSFFSSGIVYAAGMEQVLNLTSLVPALLGLMFIAIGNYLPKCRQNRTLGIKLPWTFHTEENWNKTHRIGGITWVFGGVLMVCTLFMPGMAAVYLMLPAILLMVLIPTVYSYMLYRRQVQAGEIPAIAPAQRGYLMGGRYSAIFAGAIILFVVVIMFTGNIEVTFDEDQMMISGSYWHDLAVEYTAIDQVEYREDLDGGVRTSGFGSARLQMGAFTNAELGTYTRYCYTGCDASIVLTVGDKMLVVNGKDAAETQTIYQQLLERIG